MVARALGVTLVIAAAVVPATAAAAAAVNLAARLSGPTEVAPGGTAVFTMSAETGGATPAGLRMTLTLMQGVTYESSSGAGPCTQDSATVTTCTVTGGQSPEWQITARIADWMPLGSDLYAEAEVSSDDEETDPSDNTAEITYRVGREGDLTLTAAGPAEPVVPGKPFRLTVTVRYEGSRPIDKLLLMSGVEGTWYSGYADIENVPAECFADPGQLTCEVNTRIEPGQTIELRYVFQTRATEETWGSTARISFHTYDFGEEDRVSTTVRFAEKATPSPSGTTPPAGGEGGGSGGGLPVTGSATLPLVGVGLVLLLAGAGAILVARRRGTPLR